MRRRPGISSRLVTPKQYTKFSQPTLIQNQWFPLDWCLLLILKWWMLRIPLNMSVPIEKKGIDACGIYVMNLF